MRQNAVRSASGSAAHLAAARLAGSLTAAAAVPAVASATAAISSTHASHRTMRRPVAATFRACQGRDWACALARTHCGPPSFPRLGTAMEVADGLHRLRSCVNDVDSLRQAAEGADALAALARSDEGRCACGACRARNAGVTLVLQGGAGGAGSDGCMCNSTDCMRKRIASGSRRLGAAHNAERA